MPDAICLRWDELTEDVRADLQGKLAGLYNAESDKAAFESLVVDKQQALLLLYRRIEQLDLWQAVHQVENVYGLGGVGMNFAAWPMLASTLRRRRDFSTLFAKHPDTSGGFYERRRARAVLHFLYIEDKTRRWSVHFDLDNPIYSLASAFRHLRFEAFGGFKPDWKTIKAALDVMN